MTPAELFGEWLRDVRLGKKMTQTEVGARLKMSERYVYQIENGRTDIRLSTLVRILKGLDLKWDDLKGVLV